MKTHTIHLAPELDTFLHDQITSGAYSNTNDVMTEALNLLKREHQQQSLKWHYSTAHHQKPKPRIKMDRTARTSLYENAPLKHLTADRSPLRLSRFFSA